MPGMLSRTGAAPVAISRCLAFSTRSPTRTRCGPSMTRAAFDQLDLRSGQQLTVDVLQALRLGRLGRRPARHLEVRMADVPAVARRLAEGVAVGCRVHQQLLRHAAADDAGAADAAAFDDRHLGAMRRGAARGGHAAGAGADHHQVEVSHRAHFSGGKITFQSFFMLIRPQPMAWYLSRPSASRPMLRVAVVGVLAHRVVVVHEHAQPQALARWSSTAASGSRRRNCRRRRSAGGRYAG